MSSASPDKQRLIKDPIWGNVEVFPWENGLLNHFLFNRLHNIVQNSSAYKVYPGLKYSRFLHSIGVSHVVSKLFLNSANSACTEAKAALRREEAVLEEGLDKGPRERITAVLSKTFACDPDDMLGLAVLRIAALVHDIGHLPFSHVFENALDGFCRTELGSAIRLSDASSKQREELNTHLAVYDGHDHGELPKLHEILGQFFLEALIVGFQSEPLLASLLRGAKSILHEGRLPILKGFLVGTIDADRIDFVRRDGLFSGLFTSSVDFGRLSAFYELGQDKETRAWKPRPSARTLSETEKLLMERFWDYKYIVVHHRVHLYDEIMENVLVRLMADGTLGNFLDTLLKLLRRANSASLNLSAQAERLHLLQSLLTEFDDPWLEVAIRKQYNDCSADPALNLLLQAYVEDRRTFKSAFKSDEDFQTLCQKYAPDLLEHPDAVRVALGASKYIIQGDLSDKLSRVVLIGSVDKKLSFGIRTPNEARFVKIDDLYAYLYQKKAHSLTFNFWFEDKGILNENHESVVAKALDLIRRTVINQLFLTDLQKSS